MVIFVIKAVAKVSHKHGPEPIVHVNVCSKKHGSGVGILPERFFIGNFGEISYEKKGTPPKGYAFAINVRCPSAALFDR